MLLSAANGPLSSYWFISLMMSWYSVNLIINLYFYLLYMLCFLHSIHRFFCCATRGNRLLRYLHIHVSVDRNIVGVWLRISPASVERLSVLRFHCLLGCLCQKEDLGKRLSVWKFLNYEHDDKPARNVPDKAIPHAAGLPNPVYLCNMAMNVMRLWFS